ncbi:MAG TPA: cytochrome c [Candidatus Limnocylindria bacterium]|nr:cytochrome c [Candidatus Limnocylindria bacterium]
MPSAWTPVAAVLVLLLAGPARADDLGARLYTERCSACHGDQGRGDGPTAPALQPPPRDFGSAEFWKGRTIEDLRAVVKGGKPGTMMPPFEGVLTDAEIDAVVASLRRFAPPGVAPK